VAEFESVLSLLVPAVVPARRAIFDPWPAQMDAFKEPVDPSATTLTKTSRSRDAMRSHRRDVEIRSQENSDQTLRPRLHRCGQPACNAVGLSSRHDSCCGMASSGAEFAVVISRSFLGVTETPPTSRRTVEGSGAWRAEEAITRSIRSQDRVLRLPMRFAGPRSLLLFFECAFDARMITGVAVNCKV
jgi:hypothetical protein